MIRITVYRKRGRYYGLSAVGHAEYGESGSDIICAAASALLTNAVNSIEQLSGDAIADEIVDDGFLSVMFPNGLSEKGKLLMDSLLLGLSQMADLRSEDTNEPYVQLFFEEV